MLRVFEDWRWSAGRPSPKLIRHTLETALVLLLALQSARLILLFLTPVGPLGNAAPVAGPPTRAVDLTVLERFDPFFRFQADPGGAAQAPSEGGLSLFGVRSDGRGGGSAILGTPGGAQNLFVVGDDVGGGLVLRVVAPDHVILTRAGSRVRVEFSDAVSLPAPTAAVGPVLAPAGGPVQAPRSGGLNPSQFLSAAALSPTMKDGQIAGYRVMARGSGDALARAGLQDGDILISVDGSSLNPERISELPDLLSKAQDVEVRFERNGQPMTTRLGTVSR
jgi:general secretion pathway protein C